MRSMRCFRGLVCTALVAAIFLSVLPAHATEQIYKKWLEEEVVWIINSQERAQFVKLNSDQERNQFVERFWIRRDPTPGLSTNPFKVEHYRRLAFANQHFAAGVAGWKSDRGRFYIVNGPPDRIEGFAPQSKDATDSAVPYQIWYYSHLDQLNRETSVKFVDSCRCGEYKQERGAPPD